MFDVTDKTQSSIYKLRGLVCYYGKHYNTYIKSVKGNWLVFDDVTVKKV